MFEENNVPNFLHNIKCILKERVKVYMTIKEAINKASIELKMNKIENPKQKARLLMQFLLKQPRQYIIVNDDKNLNNIEKEKYFKIVNKLINGIPLQHVTHMQEFMKMNFYVDENVLIPRPDTEILVEEVIKIAKTINAKKILDLCTREWSNSNITCKIYTK